MFNVTDVKMVPIPNANNQLGEISSSFELELECG